MSEAGEETTPSRPRQSWAWPVASMVVIGLLVGGSVWAFRACVRVPVETVEKAGDVVEKVGDVMEQVASAFKKGTITTSFTSYATTLGSTHYLQFAKLQQMELFSRADEMSIGYFTLPEVVVEARAPIEYTYYVDLSGEWTFLLKDNVLHAYPPEIEFNAPSVDVSKIEYEVRKGILGTGGVKEDLKKSITFLAAERARENVTLVRETGRRAVEEFVEQWLMRSFSDGTNYPVKVHFPGEEPVDPFEVPVEAMKD